MRLLLAASLLFASSMFAHAEPPRYADRWVYCSHNLLVDKNVNDLLAIMERASKSGYTGVMLADYKFNILDRMPDRYFKNVERVKKAAGDLKLEIIPSLFPIGYSDGIFAHDPNLAEGVPVKNAPFIVKDRQIVPESAPIELKNPGFEEAKGDRFIGLGFQDEPGIATFVDRSVHRGGAVSCRWQDSPKNVRLMQAVSVRPWTCYRFSCWVKTTDLKPCEFKLLALPASKSGRNLTFNQAHLKENQDWSQVDVVFNSLEESRVNLYVGVWGGLKGKIWVDDLALEEMPLVNVLRRDACPLSIASADGQMLFEEGKDYMPVRDEKLFKATGGGFDYSHAGPSIQLTERSRLKHGDRLLLGWYHPIIVHGSQVPCSLVDPKVFAILKDQARRVYDLFHPKTVFMAHDEIRVAGWCKLAERSGKTPGQLLADNVKECVRILKAVDPQLRIAVWSDMFDPNHNAVDNYYLINGTLKGSWEGLPPETIVANWNSGKAAASLKWFADRGHPQIIAGYYDGDITNFNRWDAAAKDTPKIQGFMYTTWRHKYDHLEEYGSALRK